MKSSMNVGDITNAARAAHGHIDGISDIEALALSVSSLTRLSRDRLRTIERLTRAGRQ